MTAYLVALIERPEDGKHWATTEYRPTFERLLEQYGGEMIVGSALEQVEGEPLAESRVAMWRFPSATAAREFWNHPEYRAVVPIRQPLGTFQIFIAPGLDEAPWTPPPLETA